MKSCALKFFPMRTSRAGGRVRCLCLSRTAKPKDLSSDHRAGPTQVTSTKELWLRDSTPKNQATSPKDLGTYSPREIHMRKPMSGRVRNSAYAPTFGFSSNVRRKTRPGAAAKDALQPAKKASQQPQRPPQKQRPTELSPSPLNTQKVQSFAYSPPLGSLSYPVRHGLLECLKGNPRAPRLEGSYLSQP